MSPNNSDPNNPNSPSTQPDLSSVLSGSAPLPTPIQPDPAQPTTSPLDTAPNPNLAADSLTPTTNPYSSYPISGTPYTPSSDPQSNLSQPEPIGGSTPLSTDPGPVGVGGFTATTPAIKENPWPIPPIQPEPVSSLPNPAVSTEPMATFTPSSPIVGSDQSPISIPTSDPNLSPPIPTFTPLEAPTTHAQPEPMATFTPPQPEPLPIQPELVTNPTPLPTAETAEPAPTDLSHLISTQNSGTDSGVYNPPLTQPETLVAPNGDGTTVGPNIPTDTAPKKSFPIWVIGVAVGLLLIVAGVSAYFILGIGQPKQEGTSLPATQQTAIPTQAPVVAKTTAVQTTPATATGSAGFGQFQSGGSTSSSSGSAADILRSRLGQ